MSGQTVTTLHVKAGLQARRFIYFPEERKEVLVGSMRRYTPSFIYRRKTGLGRFLQMLKKGAYVLNIRWRDVTNRDIKTVRYRKMYPTSL